MTTVTQLTKLKGNTMRTITAILITLTLVGSVTYAQDDFTPEETAHYATLILASDLDAVTCTGSVSSVFTQQNATCYELEWISASLHKTFVDLHLQKYDDLESIGPWQGRDGGYFRVYHLEGLTLMLAVLDYGYGSVGGFVPLME